MIELLILQPTPFCNLNCSYCYLPDRRVTKRMSQATLEAALQNAFSSGMVGDELTLVWHAGEPLVMPIEFYERARAIAVELGQERGVHVRHSFQTNATLINDAWCDFFEQPDVLVGVSVDGPAFLHDLRRRTWDDRPTHARVMAGIDRLRARGIPYYVISVVTDEALDHADELYAFYCENGMRRVGLNVEEIEGPHKVSSLSGSGATERYAAFLGRLFDLATGGSEPLEIREFEGAMSDVTYHDWRPVEISQEARAGSIVSVDCDGNFSTFSPELLGAQHENYGSFAFGNVHDMSFAAMFDSPAFQRVARDVAAGVERCRATCTYFDFCGGGAPANKVFEHGTFDVTETLFCRFSKKAVVDVVRGRLERGFTRVRLSPPLAAQAGTLLEALDEAPPALFPAFALATAAFLGANVARLPDDARADLVGVSSSHTARLDGVFAAVNLSSQKALVQTEYSAARLAPHEAAVFETAQTVVMPSTAELGVWLVFRSAAALTRPVETSDVNVDPEPVMPVVPAVAPVVPTVAPVVPTVAPVMPAVAP